MAWWVELSCDVKSDGPPEPSRLQNFCFSQSGRGIRLLTGESQIGTKAISMIAKMNGWQHKRGKARGWACPNCKTVVEW